MLALSADGPVRVLRINDDGPLHPPAAPAQPRRGKSKDKKVKENHQTQAASPLPADGQGHPHVQLPYLAALVDEEE